MFSVKNGEDREFDFPQGIFTKPTSDGVLLLSTREEFSDCNPEHVRAANLLNQALAAVRESNNDFIARRMPSALSTTA